MVRIAMQPRITRLPHTHWDDVASDMENVIATVADRPLEGQWPPAAAQVSDVTVIRVTALMAGGSLLAASAALLSTARDLPHPWHQTPAALITFVLGLILLSSVIGISARNYRAALIPFGAITSLVIFLPLVRYIPLVYTVAYEQDLESLFPSLWPYSASIPLLIALLGELALSRRQKSAPTFLLVASLVPASMLLFFSAAVIQAMAATIVAVVMPWRTLLAFSVSIGVSALIVLGTAVATRDLAWMGVVVLMGTGLFLEIGSTFFYGVASPKLFDPGLPPISPWLAFTAGTVPGALTLLISIMVVVTTTSRSRPTYS